MPAWFTECYGMHKQKVALMIRFQHSGQLTMNGWCKMATHAERELGLLLHITHSKFFYRVVIHRCFVHRKYLFNIYCHIQKEKKKSGIVSGLENIPTSIRMHLNIAMLYVLFE